jgi:hypothetical protein
LSNVTVRMFIVLDTSELELDCPGDFELAPVPAPGRSGCGHHAAEPALVLVLVLVLEPEPEPEPEPAGPVVLATETTTRRQNCLTNVAHTDLVPLVPHRLFHLFSGIPVYAREVHKIRRRVLLGCTASRTYMLRKLCQVLHAYR